LSGVHRNVLCSRILHPAGQNPDTVRPERSANARSFTPTRSVW
jgi:hypothetical protein